MEFCKERWSSRLTDFGLWWFSVAQDFFVVIKCLLPGSCCSCIIKSSWRRFLWLWRWQPCPRLTYWRDLLGPLRTCSFRWSYCLRTRNFMNSLTKFWGKDRFPLVSRVRWLSCRRWRSLCVKHERVGQEIRSIYCFGEGAWWLSWRHRSGCGLWG